MNKIDIKHKDFNIVECEDVSFMDLNRYSLSIMLCRKISNIKSELLNIFERIKKEIEKLYNKVDILFIYVYKKKEDIEDSNWLFSLLYRKKELDKKTTPDDFSQVLNKEVSMNWNNNYKEKE